MALYKFIYLLTYNVVRHALQCNATEVKREKKKKITHEVCYEGAHPWRCLSLFHLTKLAYKLVGWPAQLAASAFNQLRWLKMEQRIEYKLALLAYRGLHRLAPPYLANKLQLVSTCLLYTSPSPRD